MKEFYVYLHRRLSDNKPFYVGKGKGRRAWIASSRNVKWQRTVAKHGLVVEMLFEDLDEQEAFRVEIDCILELRSFGYNLCNITNGGEGCSGHKLSEAHKDKISKRQKGRVKSEQERMNISKSQKGKAQPDGTRRALLEANLGKNQTEETKRKRALKLKEVGTCNDRNIYVFFSKCDVFIGTRKELSEYSNIELKKLKSLFGKHSNKVVSVWSVLKLDQLFLIKENLYDYCN